MRNNLGFLTWITSLFAVVGFASAQTPEYQKISFHVTSVKFEPSREFCNRVGDTCTATDITVEGYAKVMHSPHSTQYVLRCSEAWAQEPSAHQTLACVRLHANPDYLGELFDDSISFLDESKPRPSSGPVVPNYDILSEREVISSQVR